MSDEAKDSDGDDHNSEKIRERLFFWSHQGNLSEELIYIQATRDRTFPFVFRRVLVTIGL